MFKWLKEWGEEVKNRFQAVVPGYFGGGTQTIGYKTSATAGDILADTGSLSAGIYDITIMFIGASLTDVTSYSIEHRNAANTANIWQHIQYFNISTGPCAHLPFFHISEGERFRVTVYANTSSTIQASVIWARLFPLKRGQ